MPAVRFFLNRGGQRLAYEDQGRGDVLIMPPWWVSHLARDRENPAFRRFVDRLATKLRVVHYDRAGVGLSDRTRSAESLEDEVETLECLVEHLGVTRAHLLGFSCGGPVAIAFASRHPDVVQRMVLVGSFVDGATLAPVEVQRALIGLVRASWGLGSRTLADVFHPGAGAASHAAFARLQRDGADRETAARLLELTYRLDATPFVEGVRAPTLVVHRAGDRTVRFDQGRKLAGRISGATLLTLDGEVHLAWEGVADPIVDAVHDFLAVAPTVPSAARAGDDAPGAELLREGDVWRAKYAGRRTMLKHGKGLVDLARLLARPAESIHVLELAAPVAGTRLDPGAAPPRFDRRALASYRRRIAELEAALGAAVDAVDSKRQRTLAAERLALLRHIQVETGVGGRVRTLADPVERARKAVTARLRETIERIAAAHPSLGKHLEASIVTGVHCIYRPTDDVRWTVSPDPT